ncbi:MAG: cob(I)yrinic acid a,c-diamide adenosyltransferase [Candidatus Omnitrophota bacterium]
MPIRVPRSRKINKTKIRKSPRRKGLIIVHTGEGKGKTTAALGLALRAIGSGMSVLVAQFIKGGWNYGELEAAKRLSPELKIIQLGKGCTWETRYRKKDVAISEKAWEFCKKAIRSREYDLVILDEINYVLGYGFLDAEEVVDFLKQRPEEAHVVLTGRHAPKTLIEAADLVTEMKEIKHPFRRGIPGQRGIEY